MLPFANYGNLLLLEWMESEIERLLRDCRGFRTFYDGYVWISAVCSYNKEERVWKDNSCGICREFKEYIACALVPINKQCVLCSMCLLCAQPLIVSVSRREIIPSQDSLLVLISKV